MKRITSYCGESSKLIHPLSAKARNQPKVQTQCGKIPAASLFRSKHLEVRVTRKPGDGEWVRSSVALKHRLSKIGRDACSAWGAAVRGLFFLRFVVAPAKKLPWMVMKAKLPTTEGMKVVRPFWISTHSYQRV